MQENMDNFIPKNAVKLCNKCEYHNRGTVTCKIYPNGIPYDILIGKPLCEKFKERQSNPEKEAYDR